MEQSKQQANKISALSEIITKLGHKPLSEMTAEEKLARAQRMADRVNAQSGSLTGYDCPECRNKGFIETVIDNTARMGYPCYTTGSRECKCMPVRRSKWLLKASGLAHLAERCTFDAYKAVAPWQKAIKAGAERFRLEDTGFFFVGGQSGSGKTHICTALAVSFINRGKSTRYMLWTDESAKIKACVNNDEQYAARVWPLKEADVLYIDDLFKPTGINAQPSAADIRLAYEIINYRYNAADKITIISSERTIDEIFAIDEAIGGRIREYTGDNCHNIGRDKAKNYRMRDARA